MKKIVLLAVLVLMSAAAGFAQKKMYEPKKGSPERQTLADAIRSYDTLRNSALKGEIFGVNAMQVQGDWAFASVERTNLPDAGQGTLLAFLRRSGGSWKVIWSDYNDNGEVGVDALKRLRKRYRDFSKQLADFAENGYLAG
ncbi:MAG TPA: hypothetical protein PKA82_00260 [Pyrinomonadaceae bacterium]|nr:hypothetical protein [Pyrinomonadaceae bacterium]